MIRVKFGILTMSLLCLFFYSHAENKRLSLNTSNPEIIWKLMPASEVEASGYEISEAGYIMKNYVEGIVPGVVFTSYVEAGLEKDPDYADNIYRIDETFYNRPFWYRTEFAMPSSLIKGSESGFILIILTDMPIFILTG